MRKLVTIAAAGLIAVCSTAALAQTNGWYLGAGVGATWMPNLSGKVPGASGHISADNPGLGILGDAGYGFGQFRIEGELGWQGNNAHSTTIGGNAGLHGHLNALDLMVNGLYDIPTGSAFSPHIGAGIGAIDWDNDLTSEAGGVSTPVTSKSEWTFGYQGIAGVNWDINDNLALTVDYRYIRSLETSFPLSPASPAAPGDLKATYQNNEVLVGFMYKFGAPPPPPPMAQAAAPPPPPPPAAPPPAPAPVAQPPVPKNFLVFFDFDKSDIKPDAQKIIDTAAQNFKSNNATVLHVTGYTDTVGTAQYNLALSLRRANAVKAALVQDGVPENEITVLGKGKTDLLVPTADGVREPQNRRAEMVIDAGN